MCVIITKTKEQTKPTKEFLEKAWKHNPDGAGFMYTKDKQVIISKGFMDFKSFYKAVEKLPNDAPIVYHFRIATHGARDAKGTHPFPITNKPWLLQKSRVITDMGVAHNGIISMCTKYTKEENPYDLSDTQLFIKDYMTRLTQIKDWNKSRKVLTMIGELIRSKMVLLDKQGALIYIGDFVEVDGYKCSNNYFKPVYTNVYSNIDDYDDYYYKSSYSKYNTKYEDPIQVPKTLENIVYVEETTKRGENLWNFITDFDSVTMSCYGTIKLNGEYSFNSKLVDYNGNYVDFEGLKKLIKENEDIEEEVESEVT